MTDPKRPSAAEARHLRKPEVICECGHRRDEHDEGKGTCAGCFHRSADSKRRDYNTGCIRFRKAAVQP
jgi:hypothetical protein